MDQKALFNLSYGVFVLGVKDGEKLNACITNTGMQVTTNPMQIVITVINANETCKMLKKSGTFALSILDKTCDFETIKHFGLFTSLVLLGGHLGMNNLLRRRQRKF